MEWIELVLGNYTAILEQAGIYGVIAVARYPYNICADVLRDFLELWSLLTNTLHFAGGGIGLSLESSPEIEYNISFTNLTNQIASPSVVNEPASKVPSPVLIDPELSVNLVMDLDDTQLTRVSQPVGILSDTQTEEEVSLTDISKKMVTNFGTKVDKFSRNFIIYSFQAIVKLMTSSNLCKLLKSREAISKHLMRLTGVVLDGNSGPTEVNWFVE
ncbi:hypothetical protein ACH5RR_023784 [Cinchona calisaya]|uniref:Uncharacterized protein n=1 Tax=Cinchona calisaya TaxID=153742 RepID=A0ABD2ZBL6_9GENT